MANNLPTILYDDGGNIRPIYTLAPSRRPDMASVLAFALPKAGSVLLHNLLKDACDVTGMSYVSIMEEFFKLGLPNSRVPAQTRDIFLPHGYCFGGFRTVPPQLEIPIIDSAPSIYLVRDPRDLVVSNYFSTAYSHPERGSALKTSEPGVAMRDLALNSAIDDYVLRIAINYRTFFARYRKLLSAASALVTYRYEDVVYRKAEWLADIAAHFGWAEITSTMAQPIADRHNIIPEKERQRAHIRNVHPGDFRNKLQAETIAQLDIIFACELDEFGYRENGKRNFGLRWIGA